MSNIANSTPVKPGHVALDKINDHLGEVNSGELAAADSVAKPQKKVTANAQSNRPQPGQTDESATDPGAISFGGDVGKALENAPLTLDMIASMQDPANSAILGQAMMLLLKDAFDAKKGSKKEVLAAGLAKINNAIDSAMNQLKLNEHQRDDLKEKLAADLTAAWGSVMIGCLQIGAGALGGALSSNTGLSEAIKTGSASLGSFNTALQSFTQARKDQIDLDSKTWDDKKKQGELEVTKTRLEADSQTKSSDASDDSDAYKRAYDNFIQFISKAKEMKQAATLNK